MRYSGFELDVEHPEWQAERSEEIEITFLVKNRKEIQMVFNQVDCDIRSLRKRVDF